MSIFIVFYRSCVILCEWPVVDSRIVAGGWPALRDGGTNVCLTVFSPQKCWIKTKQKRFCCSSCH